MIKQGENPGQGNHFHLFTFSSSTPFRPPYMPQPISFNGNIILTQINVSVETFRGEVSSGSLYVYKSMYACMKQRLNFLIHESPRIGLMAIYYIPSTKLGNILFYKFFNRHPLSCPRNSSETGEGHLRKFTAQKKKLNSAQRDLSLPAELARISAEVDGEVGKVVKLAFFAGRRDRRCLHN